ncbi:hypothetical protein K438DRAFT_1961825 [Mycena galopus ATCC 62051]|nr:hypothetical protein K438DRAFT_1961825 [Mycena galopus ATCC 62051]
MAVASLTAAEENAKGDEKKAEASPRNSKRKTQQSDTDGEKENEVPGKRRRRR